MFAYQLYTSGPQTAYAVTNTSDFGDIPIPRGYRQAMESEHADYWREAITAELKGLIANDTWEKMLLCKLPKGANLMS